MFIGRVMDKQIEITFSFRHGREDVEHSRVEAEFPKRQARFIARCTLQVWSLMDHAGFFEEPSALRYKRWMAHMIGSLNVVPQCTVQLLNSLADSQRHISFLFMVHGKINLIMFTFSICFTTPFKLNINCLPVGQIETEEFSRTHDLQSHIV